MENNPHSINDPKDYSFILFVFGMSPKSLDAVENLNHICGQYLKNNFDLQIIDISRDKELAEKHQILAIPTLMKIKPAPQRTILGDLSDKAKVLKLLDIEEQI
ncbi:circadian clock KaiB family protein [Flavobacterium sp. 3HN19-14]|uniref:circadian clock KaiB family protein n=1 Tax=Flavobacterium sp. 3HN19-14 TaxID=3448133 RepID=UPI003EDED371